ncbi:MAG: hypothetical protein R3A10_16120 [Caldilineaceae bacterium]
MDLEDAQIEPNGLDPAAATTASPGWRKAWTTSCVDAADPDLASASRRRTASTPTPRPHRPQQSLNLESGSDLAQDFG